MNIANPRAQRGRDEKRQLPEQFSEFKTPWGQLGSNETPMQGRRVSSCLEVARTASVLPLHV